MPRPGGQPDSSEARRLAIALVHERAAVAHEDAALACKEAARFLEIASDSGDSGRRAVQASRTADGLSETATEWTRRQPTDEDLRAAEESAQVAGAWLRETGWTVLIGFHKRAATAHRAAGAEHRRSTEPELNNDERKAAHLYFVEQCEDNTASGWLDLLLYVAGADWVRGAVEEWQEANAEELASDSE